MEYAAQLPTWLPTAFRIRSIAQASRSLFPSPGRRSHEVSRYLLDPRAGWRRAQSFSHRLHGLEGSGQRSRPDAHLPASLEGSAPRQLPESIEEIHETRFRFVGRLRAEFCRPADPVRERRLFGLLEPCRWREPEHPHVRLRRLGALSA